MTTFEATRPRATGIVNWLSGPGHRVALFAFIVINVAHYSEHIAQAFQIWVLGWPVPESRGALGVPLPWLATSEWLHYGYAIVTLAGLLLLHRGFAGRGRAWWTAAIVFQFWHHLEHVLLLVQAQIGTFFFGGTVPTSIVQVLVPRVELHLVYNTAVFLPMVVALYLHLRPSASDRERVNCTCAGPLVSVDR